MKLSFILSLSKDTPGALLLPLTPHGLFLFTVNYQLLPVFKTGLTKWTNMIVLKSRGAILNFVTYHQDRRRNMNARAYEDVLRRTFNNYCQMPQNIVYVENIAEWCQKEGIPEPDTEKPVKVISKGEAGCKMIVREEIPDHIVDERINAMHIRGQVENVALDRADKLDSDEKKIVFLFLSEYALGLSDIEDNELLADNWAFDEMEKLGFFKK